MGLIFGILSNCIWQYSSLAKFMVMLYNLKYGFHDWQDFNLASCIRVRFYARRSGRNPVNYCAALFLICAMIIG